MESIEEPIPLTAPQIAVEHFTRELLGHAQQNTEAETVVILHDACYGHRFSRMKSTKATLSMIVERPERIHASILGASTAYVRLGGHHAGAKHAPHPDRTEPSKAPFTIRRSTRALDIMSPYVTNVHGTAWMEELQGMCQSAGEKLAAGVKELSRKTGPGEAEHKQLHEGDLYLAPESLNAFQGALGGIADAVDAVFAPSKTTRAFVAVRPPGHHCSADHPSGFCWLNNVHVGIEYAAQAHGLTHAAIFDFDLHHGDGSQAITWERNSKNNIKRLSAKPTTKLKLGPDIGYYSIHDINSYPCEMGDDEKVQAASLCIDNAHGQSVWNVHLQPWKTEADFWRLYEEKYSILFEKARLFLQQHTARITAENKVQPRAAIFISAGFDASEWEGAGMQRHKVNVPTEFYARFTQDVLKLSQETGTACETRVISVLEGGYSDRALCSGVLSHLSGLCTDPAAKSTDDVEAMSNLNSRMGGMSLSGLAAKSETGSSYDRDWWSASNLTALENKINPPPPPQAKKVRTGPQPTYATPTESFAYKVVDANKFARSVSGTMREAPVPVRAPTPPPPEVDWVVATQELSKLLIPTDRQTKSCTPEELAGPRTKKERETIGPIEVSANPRQLRDRRGKAPGPTDSLHSDEIESVRSVSRSSRRETIDVLPSDSQPAPNRRASRRLSAGSALSASIPEVDTQAPPVPTLPKTNGAAKPPSSATNGLDVKKSRVPAKVESQKPLTSRVPSSTTLSRQSTASSSGPPANGETKPRSSDVENLTSGMKKITLKVSGTKEEHDRRQKEKLDAERRARALKGAETRRINAAAKKAAGETAARPASKLGKPATVKQGPSTQSIPPPRSGSTSTQPVSSKPHSVPQVSATPAVPNPPQPISNAGNATAPMQPVAQSTPAINVAQPPINPELNVAPIPSFQQPAPADFPVSYAPMPEAMEIIHHPVTANGLPMAAQSAPQYLGSVNLYPHQVNQMAQPAMAPVYQSAPTQQYPTQLPIGAQALPKWTSTGPIPFGGSGAAMANMMQQRMGHDPFTNGNHQGNAAAAFSSAQAQPRASEPHPEFAMTDQDGNAV